MGETTKYTIQILRSGQPRAYAATERECLITVETIHYGKKDFEPWLLYGDVEARIKREEAERAAGRMSGGETPEQLRKGQRDWCKKIVRTLFQDFREKNDDDGRTGMAAAFYPTLKSLVCDGKAGTIKAFITEEYTD